MKRTQFNFQQALHRRTVLRGAGVSLALPWLTAMKPSFAAPKNSTKPHRFVAMTLGLGLHADNLNPEQEGAEYKPSPYLEAIDGHRDKFTVVSGSSHPGVNGGHRAEASLLTANPGASVGRARNTISFDQHLAKYLGHQTRFPSLVLSSRGSNSPSYTENGAMIPAEDSPSRLFDRLFVDETPEQRKQEAQRIRQGRSIMDLVADDAKRLSRTLGSGDRDRLDAYFTSVRGLEKRLEENEQWARLPKPKVDAPRPVDIGNSNDFIGRQRLMNDMIKLALQTDSSRFITYHLGGSGGVLPIAGVAEGYHSLSHHGQDEEKLQQLALVETEIIRAWGDFLAVLDESEDEEGSLLDHTTILLTSNLGNASSHNNRNMPVLVAGGGFRHGRHLAFDRKNNYPLPNLFVSVMQQLGLQQDSFASGNSTMTGLEPTA